MCIAVGVLGLESHCKMERCSGVIMVAEKLKPSVLLLAGTRKGIWLLKLCFKTPIRKIKGPTKPGFAGRNGR